MKRLLLPIGLLILLFSACEKWDLPPTFIEIRLLEPNIRSTSSIALNGQIDMDVPQADDHGFLWSLGIVVPDLSINSGQITKGNKNKKTAVLFSDTLKNLRPGQLYSFRAYATLGDEVYYSDTLQYLTDGGQVITEEPLYNLGTSITFRGQITGTDAGIFAVSHGFCWSSNNSEPDASSDCIELGVWRTSNIFTHNFTDLIAGEPLYIRAFARLQVNETQKTVYGATFKFDGNLRDIWSILPDTIPLNRESAVSFSLGGLGYIGTGKRLTATGAEEYLKDFWSFDPQTQQWTKIAPLPEEALGRVDAIAFAIESQGLGYVATGQPQQGLPLQDCWAYDPNCDCWFSKAPYAGGNRSGAVAVSIGTKAYVGMGRNTFSTAQSDWWEYDPLNDEQKDDQGRALGKWTRQNSMPPARVQGVAFALGEKAYVGIGEKGSGGIDDELSDFWAFTPDASKGSWQVLNNFGGVSRIDGVAISVQDQRAFMGLGSNEGTLTYSDWWEYLPDLDKWEKRSEFQGEGRKGVVVFALGGQVYLGTGTNLQQTTSTFWKYDAQ